MYKLFDDCFYNNRLIFLRHIKSRLYRELSTACKTGTTGEGRRDTVTLICVKTANSAALNRTGHLTVQPGQDKSLSFEDLLVKGYNKEEAVEQCICGAC